MFERRVARRGGARRHAGWLALCAGLAFAPGTAFADVFFSGLGDLPPGDFASRANDVSGDGSTAVGDSKINSSTLNPISSSFRWTLADGMTSIYPFQVRNTATRSNFDGSAAAGVDSDNHRAYRWTSSTGVVYLGDLPGGASSSQAAGINADGSVVVGGSYSASGFEAFRWTQAGGMVGLGDLPGGAFSSEAVAVSASGEVIAGNGSANSGGQAFRWTAADGLVGLGLMAGGSFTNARSISADGAAIVGWGDDVNAGGNQAFRWTEAEGFVGLGDLAGGTVHSVAMDVSADGSAVVGLATAAQGSTAFVWDAARGMRSLLDVLTQDYGLDLAGWRLTFASGVSDDGLVIVGAGINPNGDAEAWIASLRATPEPTPEPAATSLLGLGFLMLALRRRYARGAAAGARLLAR